MPQHQIFVHEGGRQTCHLPILHHHQYLVAEAPRSRVVRVAFAVVGRLRENPSDILNIFTCGPCLHNVRPRASCIHYTKAVLLVTGPEEGRERF